MLALYNLFLPLLLALARIAGIFSQKLRRGLSGRNGLIEHVRSHYAAAQIHGSRIIIHVASYGELEQAKPVIAAIRKQYPYVHIHLTFFSPSGYENVIGKYMEVDYISYSPLDIRSEVSTFLNAVQPDLALFARYDVWPNMAMELSLRNIPTILFAATAAEESRRMMPLVRSLHKAVYNALTKILVITEADQARFSALGVDSQKLAVVGDTRFDQVIARRQASVPALLPAKLRESIEDNGTLVFILGSAWPADEAVVHATIRSSLDRGDNILWIIAPHEPDAEHIQPLFETYRSKAIRLSTIESWSGEPIIIVDSIGKLFGLYQYADIAMIGGGFSAGLHNVLEAAVWGAATIVGPKHQKSSEVQMMIDRLAAFEVSTPREFEFVFWRMVNDDDLRISTGAKACAFVEEGQGATKRILEAICHEIPPRITRS
ncbi:MAG: glycosyltransferase N-terminal domain-containing protein [Bacteroidota bacterium]|nr:glycosyltransferase N-terminal domain-containing protein [Bacteroidota bacterium]MDP4233699.1 glycosyltransferase N-terminal domain-containing protein [Bacteroidota bacterium]MDP4242338.1 glycosyltransferase N-terminal domain-containing protein [Bacteroidota bacterium]MDP4288710.1 glycosyltransferase N-terminal domain-containing protein [Bacteroidota bacterium]